MDKDHYAHPPDMVTLLHWDRMEYLEFVLPYPYKYSIDRKGHYSV